jgi:hypothetical protein
MIECKDDNANANANANANDSMRFDDNGDSNEIDSRDL